MGQEGQAAVVKLERGLGLYVCLSCLSDPSHLLFPDTGSMVPGLDHLTSVTYLIEFPNNIASLAALFSSLFSLLFEGRRMRKAGAFQVYWYATDF